MIRRTSKSTLTDTLFPDTTLFRSLEYNCRSGECGECIATLVSGTVKELPGADPAIFNDGHRAEGKILACMCYPQSDLVLRSEEHTSELQSLMRISYDVFCLNKKHQLN